MSAIENLARPVKLLLVDVDGVMTDGGIVINNQGIETKRFHVHDGLAVRLWRQAGYRCGLLTGRVSHIVKLRAAELEFDYVRQGFSKKLPVAKEIINDCGVTPEEVCYLGDDLPDLPVMRYIGFPAAVANARSEVREPAQFTTQLAGGEGAVREVVEFLFQAKLQWDEVIRQYAS